MLLVTLIVLANKVTSNTPFTSFISSLAVAKLENPYLSCKSLAFASISFFDTLTVSVVEFDITVVLTSDFPITPCNFLNPVITLFFISG